MMNSSATLSVCLIVKNEEATIVRALESVKSIANEIIVLDTGSTDCTKEKARRFTEKVFDYSWAGDFSAARNQVLKFASKDWILIIDADEFLPLASAEKILALIQSTSPQVWGYFLECQEVSPDLPEEVRAVFPFLRLFRNHKGLEFKDKVHEYMPIKEIKQHFVLAKDLVVTHVKSASQSQKSIARNVEILEKALEVDPENPRYIYFLGAYQFNLGNFQKSLKLFKKYENYLKDDQEDLWQVTIKIAEIHNKLNHRYRYLYFLKKALKIDSRHIEPYLYLGDYFLAHDNLNKARSYYQKAYSLPIPQTKNVISPSLYNFYPRLALAALEINAGNYDLARKYAAQAQEYDAEHPKLQEIFDILNSKL